MFPSGFIKFLNSLLAKFDFWHIRPLASSTFGTNIVGMHTMGLFKKERIMFQKLFRIGILTLSWFESLILPFVNANLSNEAFEMQKKGVFWIVIRPESLILRTCECKALLERDLCMCKQLYDTTQ